MARGINRRRDELDLFSDARDSISSAWLNGAAIYMASKEIWRRAERSPENSETVREKDAARASSRDGKSRSARKFARGAPLDSNSSKFGKSFSKPLENQICSFYQINKDSKCKWQTIGDALRATPTHLLNKSLF